MAPPSPEVPPRVSSRVRLMNPLAEALGTSQVELRTARMATSSQGRRGRASVSSTDEPSCKTLEEVGGRLGVGMRGGGGGARSCKLRRKV